MNILLIKTYLIILLFFSSGLCVAQGRLYSEIYKDECRDAMTYWQSHKKDFNIAACRAGVSAEFLFSIVAPEVSQYDRLMDKAQTYALKILYTQFGNGYADFSIGKFQMKPSFIEQLEYYIMDKDTLLSLFPEVLIEDKVGKSARIERISRLEDMDWQMVYISLFCKVLQYRFSNVEFVTNEEKLKFYANAYNRGFLFCSSVLRQKQKACFPHFAIAKFCYADISLWFYNNLL